VFTGVGGGGGGVGTRQVAGEEAGANTRA